MAKPFLALSSKNVASILNEAISAAGLDNQGFSARYFRCTGATYGVDASIDPEIVRKMGRWLTPSVFHDTYVRSRIPQALIEATIPDVD